MVNRHLTRFLLLFEKDLYKLGKSILFDFNVTMLKIKFRFQCNLQLNQTYFFKHQKYLPLSFLFYFLIF